MRFHGAGTQAMATDRWAGILSLILLLGTSTSVLGQEPDQTRYWVTAGGGVGTAGWGTMLGAGLGHSGWDVTFRSVGASRERDTSYGMADRSVEEYALLVGRTVDQDGRMSTDLALGVGRVSGLEDRWTPCDPRPVGGFFAIFPSCLGDWVFDGREDLGASLGLAFALSLRETDGGSLGIGVEFHGNLNGTASYAGIAFTADVGRVR